MVALVLPPTDGPASRWGRRAVTIPLYALLAAGLLAALPLTLPVALVADLVRRRSRVVSRCVVFFTFYACFEIVGLAGCLLAWLASAGRGEADLHRRLHALQVWWARMLLAAGAWAFGLRFVVEGRDAAGTERPFLLFLRHASTGDTILPIVFLPEARLRSVLERELLWEPCLGGNGG